VNLLLKKFFPSDIKATKYSAFISTIQGVIFALKF
jgi:hypothetical protein